MIAFTCDVDWAPEEVISDTVAVFENAGVKCTFFATHESKVLRGLNRDLFEIAIHPNFNPVLAGQGSARMVLENMLKLYPEAKGVRSHSMLQSSVMLNMFREFGLLYESNHFLPYSENVKPFALWNGLVRIPYVWEDDIHYWYGLPFTDSKIDLDKSGLKVFSFHPIHVFLNSENTIRYERAKPHYHDAKKLKEFRNEEIPGTRDLLLKLLGQLQGGLKLDEIADRILQNTDSAKPWSNHIDLS